MCSDWASGGEDELDAVVWRTKFYGSWPGFDVEALQDGADADNHPGGRGYVYSCRAFFLFLVVFLRVLRPTNLQCLMFYAQICSENHPKMRTLCPIYIEPHF
jgi:hypothetical protein